MYSQQLEKQNGLDEILYVKVVFDFCEDLHK